MASAVANLKILSPRELPGAIVSAVLVHGALYGVLVGLLGLGLFQAERVAPPAEVMLGYEMLDEPPTPQAQPKAVRAPQPKAPVIAEQAPKAPVAQELQDEKGDVAGTQAAPKAADMLGSATNGSASNVPYYKIKPKYPREALISGTEGWVLLKVDVTEGGEVENVRVIDGENRGVFQSEARRAVEKWKYRPFVDGSGNPIRKADHQVRVDFKLADQG